MIPPVQQTLMAAPAVTAIVADRISRTVRPEGSARPYIVWSIPSGVPGNTLACAPDYDDQRVRIDCWSASQSEARALCMAAMAAIEPHANIIFGPVEFYEDDTKLFQWVFDATYIESR